MVDIPDKNLLAPGHRGCAGCGASIAVKLALNALGENTVAVSATGCLEVMTTPYPETAWEIPFIHVAFENSGAVASGVESALRIQGKDDVNVVAFGGDGGTVDIGLQSLSGAMERGHNMTYICYDNEAPTEYLMSQQLQLHILKTMSTRSKRLQKPKVLHISTCINHVLQVGDSLLKGQSKWADWL